MPTSQRSVLQGSPFVRLAGFSGFSACVLLLYKNHLLTKLPEPRTLAEMKLSSDKLEAEAGLLEARMKNLASSDADATNKIEEVEKTKRRIENINEEFKKRTRRINELMKQQFNVKVYDDTNNFHFLHTFALFAAPLARKPALTGTLIFGGIILNCGSGYYYAIKGPLLMAAMAEGAAENISEIVQGKKTNGYTVAVKVANPLGAFMIIVAWLTFVL